MFKGGRGRNQPGSLQRPPMTNYYRSAAPAAQSPFTPKQPKRQWRSILVRAVDIIIAGVVLFCLVYSLIVSPNPKVIVSSNQYHPVGTYQAAASKALNNFKDHNKLTFDETNLVTSLQKQFPEITKADVELPLFGQKPIIRLSIASPKFILESGGVRYVIANDGVAVAQAINFSGDDDLPVVSDQSGFNMAIGEAVLSSSQVSFINTLVTQCERAKVPIKSLTLPAKDQELDLRTSDQKYYVKFYLGGDAQVETGQFLAARHQFAASHKPPSQYLDVRVNGKIFYK